MAFNILSLELNEQIAIFLTTDREVCDFRLICHATNAAVRTRHSAVWRLRYAQRYDMQEKRTDFNFELWYKLRSRLLGKSARFHLGQEPRELRCMEIVRDLIVESYADVPIGEKAKHPSKNLKVVEEFVQRSCMLRKVHHSLKEKSNMNPHLQAIQLILTHLELQIPSGKASPTRGFAYSQCAVYAHPNDFPMFSTDGTWRISTNFLLHIVNFFKHHLTQKDEHTLYELFSELKAHEKPKAWNSRLVQGNGVKKLGKHWKGTYAYLHHLRDMDLIRQCEPGTEYYFTDSIDNCEGFQTLDLDFEPTSNRAHWPKVFESHLKAMPTETLCNQIDAIHNNQSPDIVHLPSLPRPPQQPPSPPTTPDIHPPNTALPPPQTSPPHPRTSPTAPKRGIHYHQFSGSGDDAEPFHCRGILHPLPPQYDIPDWSRISLMKFYDPLDQPGGGNDNNNKGYVPPKSGAKYDVGNAYQIEDDARVNEGCWAYEGVVLPGGMIMVGRWWNPVDEGGMRCMGPFIFWNVEGEMQ